jgi:hypothetical protein
MKFSSRHAMVMAMVEEFSSDPRVWVEADGLLSGTPRMRIWVLRTSTDGSRNWAKVYTLEEGKDVATFMGKPAWEGLSMSRGDFARRVARALERLLDL